MVNLAWLLASAGHRVLVVDSGTGFPRVADYLAHGTVEIGVDESGVDESGVDESGDARAPRAPAAWSAPFSIAADTYGAERRFLLPAGLGSIDLVVRDDQGLRGAVERLRRTSGYDLVLVDHPAAVTPDTAAGLASWCDCMLICFRPLRDQVVAAQALHRAVRQHRDGATRVVLLATQVDPGARDRQLRATLSLFGTDRETDDVRPPALVAVPYRAFDTDGALAALIDAPGDPGQPLRAYHALAEAVVPGGPPPAAVPDAVRARYRSALALATPAPERLGIVFPVRDRPWADWVAEAVDGFGVPTVRLPVGADPSRAQGCTQLVVVSAGSGAPLAAEVDRLTSLPPDRVLWLRVGASRTRTRQHDPAPSMVLTTGDATNAAAQVRAALGWVPAPAGAAPPRRLRLPGSRQHETSRRPLRHGTFIGRDDELDQLRDLLPVGSRARVTLSGPGGSGKSEIACEFCYRFADSYDLIWWVAAHSRDAVRSGLTGLAREHGLDLGGDLATGLPAALREAGRTLLVFDNADDPRAVEELVPVTETGHVIVTCRQPRGGVTLAVGPFHRQQSRELLTRWLPGLPPAAAEELGALTGHLPIAVRLGAAWLKERQEALEAQGLTQRQALTWAHDSFTTAFEDEVRGRDAATEDAPEHLTRIALGLTLQALHGPGEASSARFIAVRLAQLCSFLSPDGVSLSLLSSAQMLQELAGDAGAAGEWLAGDGLLLHYALRIGNRHGLFELNRAGRSEVRMHRMLGALLQELMPEQEREATRARALRVLAAYAPTDAEDDMFGRQENLRELAVHLIPSGALGSDDPAVRRWVVLQVRHAYRWGDVATWESTRRSAGELRQAWRERFGATDPLYLRLCVQLANLERALGRDDVALALDEEALSAQRSTLGLEHPRTLFTARGLAGDYRGLGRFHEAWLEDAATFQGLVRSLGPDHLDTIRASWNLALSRYLDGNAVQALRMSQETLEQLRRLFPADAQQLASAVLNHAMYLRELGDFQQAEHVLNDIRNRLGDGVDKQLLLNGQAISWRARQLVEKAERQHLQVERAFVRMLGEGSTHTVSVRVALSADQYVLGRPAQAADTILPCLDRLEERLPADHPFINLCRSNLALYQRAAGSAELAVASGEAAFEGLRDSLLESHPWTLAAGLNLCGHLVAAAREAEAAELREEIERLCGMHVSARHPLTAKVTGSRQDDRSCTGCETLFEIPVT